MTAPYMTLLQYFRGTTTFWRIRLTEFFERVEYNKAILLYESVNNIAPSDNERKKETRIHCICYVYLFSFGPEKKYSGMKNQTILKILKSPSKKSGLYQNSLSATNVFS